MVTGVPPASTAAQRANDVNSVLRAGLVAQGPDLILVNEKHDMAADGIPLVDDAEAKPGMAPIQLRQHFTDGRTARNHDPLVSGVGL